LLSYCIINNYRHDFIPQGEKMKQTWKAALAAVVLMGGTQIARADLTMDGQTGLINNPTAEVAKKGDAEVQFLYQHIKQPEGYSDTNVYGISGAVAAADKLEINGSAGRATSDGYRQTLLELGAKYQLLHQPGKGLDVAFGGRYAHVGNNEDDSTAKIYSLYLAGTKAFRNGGKHVPVKATLGLRWDKVSYGYYGSESKASVYGGVQVPLTQNGDVSLIGELQSKNYDDPNAKTPYALGLRWSPADKGFTLSAGINRDGILVSDKNAFFVQAGYRFGK
jgi:hypothetical protein